MTGAIIKDINESAEAKMSALESGEASYLRSDVKIEPLAWGWYAWGHLLSPISHALNLVARQIPLLKSFIANPSIHHAAAKDPAFLGGPFVQLDGSARPGALALLAQIDEQGARLITLAEDWRKLERQLRERAAGFSLETIYHDIPVSLRGLVELTYDLKNGACLRPVEELATRADFGTAAGEGLALSRTKDSQRRFFLNTPRLSSAENLLLPLRFADERIDALARARLHPVECGKLADELEVPDEMREQFSQLFTPTPTERNAPNHSAEGVRLRYFGHACVLVQTSKVSLLIDPVVAFGKEAPEATLAFDDLPDVIDFVFITHNHQDHLCPEVLLQLRHRVGTVLVARNNPGNIADPSLKLILQKIGFRNVVVMDPLDEIEIPDGAIVSLPFYGEHADLSIYGKHGLYLRIQGHTLAFLADSNCLDRALYHRLHDALGSVETLFIGMECDGAPLSWLYSPYLAEPLKRKDDESRRLSGSDCERALAVIEELHCTRVFVYAMGQEPWLQYLCGIQYTPESKQIIESKKLIDFCKISQIPATRLYGCRDIYL